MKPNELLAAATALHNWATDPRATGMYAGTKAEAEIVAAFVARLHDPTPLSEAALAALGWKPCAYYERYWEHPDYPFDLKRHPDGSWTVELETELRTIGALRMLEVLSQ